MKMRGRCRRHQLPLAVACMLLVVLPLRPSVAQEMQMSLSPKNLAKAHSAAEGAGQQGQDGGEGGAAAGFSPTPASSPSFETYQHYFALCTVTKDTPGDLREWVDYHHGLGVTKFYIFDTDQRVPNGPILQVRGSARLRSLHSAVGWPLLGLGTSFFYVSGSTNRHGLFGHSVAQC